MDSIKSRVAKGADLLDREFPGWAATIDVNALNIASISECILGQMFGRFSFGCDALGAPFEDGNFNSGPRRLWETGHGFELTHDEYTSKCVEAVKRSFDRQWVCEVKKRTA
jgi:hypothetical protein